MSKGLYVGMEAWAQRHHDLSRWQQNGPSVECCRQESKLSKDAAVKIGKHGVSVEAIHVHTSKPASGAKEICQNVPPHHYDSKVDA